MEPCNHPHLVLASSVTSNGDPLYQCLKCNGLFTVTLGGMQPTEAQFGTGNL